MITGVNSANVVNTNTTTALLPGIGPGTVASADYPPAKVREANFTIEQPFKDGSVFRVSYVFTHGENLDQNYQINDAPSTYVWQAKTGTTPPTGTFASVATRPYDNKTWGGITQSTKYGFSNDSALQFNYQRPYRRGFSYQVFYVFSRAFRVGGNTFRDNLLYPAELYAPGVIPKGMDVGTQLEPSREFNRWQNYRRRHRNSDAPRVVQRAGGCAVRQGPSFPEEQQPLGERPLWRLSDRVRRHGGVAVVPGRHRQLWRNQPDQALQEQRSGHGLPVWRVPPGLHVVQRLPRADSHQRRHARRPGSS